MKRLYLLTLVSLLALLATSLMGASRVVQVPCGTDLDAKVNADSASISTRFVLSSCTYAVNATLIPEDGDEIVGPTRDFTPRGPAFEPNPIAIVQGTSTVDQVIKPRGTFIAEWIRVQGGNFTGQAGTGTGIAMGAAASDSRVYATVVGNNEGAGITNAHGLYDRIELTNNTTNPQALGFIASGLKAVDEVEVRNSYVHDTQGNGIWGDEDVNDQPTANGKFWIHDNLVVNSGREGIRWEKVSTAANAGEALIENNRVHGNGFGGPRYGIGARDAANAIIRGNTFGEATIAGIVYGPNALGAIRASDSGRSDRPNLYNIDILNNDLNLEEIQGCELPDSIVYCAGNIR